MVLVTSLVVWRVRRDGLETELLETIGFRLSLFQAVGYTVNLLRDLELPIVVDVLVALAVGIPVSIGLRRYFVRPLLEDRV